jgi:hypothetical protein
MTVFEDGSIDEPLVFGPVREGDSAVVFDLD